MTKPNIPVYFEEFQRLVLCRLASLVIARNKYYEKNQRIINHRRSSSQRRFRRVTELFRYQLRIEAIGRWLQGSRPYLDELESNAALRRWTSRQPHPYQRQGRQDSPTNPTSLTNARHTTQSGDSISPFLFAAVVLFPLATCNLTPPHYEKPKK